MLNRFVSTPFNYFDAIQPMFRFTIRDLLWLMVVVGLLVALWIDHRDLVAVREHAVTLRQNLEIARLHYSLRPLETKSSPTVDWELVDVPIP
jgi:hypothetical protein